MNVNTGSTLPDFDMLWDFANPAQTETQFRELLPLGEKTGNHEFKMQLLTQIARTEGLQRKFDEAHATLDQVEPELVKGSVSEVRFFLERGRVFNSSKKQDIAVPLFVKAFELAVVANQDNLAVDAAHMVVIAEKSIEKQLEWNLKAMTIAQKSPDPKAQNWLGSLYNNIGWTYHTNGKFADALTMFEKALDFREKRGSVDAIRIAKWSVARVFRSLKRHEEALAIQKSLEVEHAASAIPDPYVFEELAELNLIMGNPPEAKRYFVMAYDELVKDDWFKANEGPRLARLKEQSGR